MSPKPTRQLGVAGLTRKRLTILRLYSTGATYKSIAGELGVSPNTVDGHVRVILRQLEARTMAEAAYLLGLHDARRETHGDSSLFTRDTPPQYS